MTENRMKANAVSSVLKDMLCILGIFMPSLVSCSIFKFLFGYNNDKAIAFGFLSLIVTVVIVGLASMLYEEYTKALEYERHQEELRLGAEYFEQESKATAERLANIHVQVNGTTPYLKSDFTVGHRNTDDTYVFDAATTTQMSNLLDQMAEGPERTKFLGALKSSKTKKRKPKKKAKK